MAGVFVLLTDCGLSGTGALGFPVGGVGVLVGCADGDLAVGTTGGGVLPGGGLGVCALLGVAGVGIGGGVAFGVGVLVDGTTG